MTRAADTEQLRAELAEARSQIEQLRAELRAVAALAVGIGFRTAPAGFGSIRTVTDLCTASNVSRQYADRIVALFG